MLPSVSVIFPPKTTRSKLLKSYPEDKLPWTYPGIDRLPPIAFSIVTSPGFGRDGYPDDGGNVSIPRRLEKAKNKSEGRAGKARGRLDLLVGNSLYTPGNRVGSITVIR